MTSRRARLGSGWIRREGGGGCSAAVPFWTTMGDIGKPIRETERPAPVRAPEPEPEPEREREPPPPEREPPPPKREPERVEAQRA